MFRLHLVIFAALIASTAACAGTPERGETTTGAAVAAQPVATTDAALESLRKADVALQRNFVSQAGVHLDAANASLEQLAGKLPPDPLVVEIDAAMARLERDPASVDLTPLAAKATDPMVKRSLEDARYALMAGNPEGAASGLREARLRAEQGSPRTSLDQARNRVVAARSELQQGDIAGARVLVQEAMPLLREANQQQARQAEPTPAG